MTIVDDDIDDDGESITLSFGAEPHIKSGGANETATITQTLVSNTDQGGNSDNRFTGDHGQAFTTGYNLPGYNITGVTIISEDPEGDDIALQICEVASNGWPTTTCTDLASAGPFAAGPLRFNVPTGTTLTLEARTTYMVVFKSPGGEQVRVDATDSDDNDDASLPDWEIRNKSQFKDSNVWRDRGYDRAIAIAISGTVNETFIHDNVTFDPDSVTREINENTGANRNVGAPVTATYTGTCTLIHRLGGTDADSFEIDSSTGQIKTREGVTYDHEARSTYTVTVTAYHSNCGTDDATVTINVNDVNEPPRAPLQVVAYPVPRTYDQLFVRWTPPGNAGRPDITGYDIQYEFGDSGIWNNGPQNVDGTSGIITGLRHGAYYEVRVRAKNDEGSGPWSEQYFVITNILDFEVQLSSTIVPDGLVPGDSFHLLIVTDPVRARNTKMIDYSDKASTPVIQLPTSNDLFGYWQFFNPVVSTRHIDARIITNTTYTNEDKGVPIHWVGGAKATDDYEDFYDGDWDDESARNARGQTVALPNGVWTGSTADGRELMDGGTSRALGESMAGYGAPGSTVSGEGPIYSGSTAANTALKPILALSSVFRVVHLPLVSNVDQTRDTDDRRSAMRSQVFTTGSNRHGYEFSGVSVGKHYTETSRIEIFVYSVDGNGDPDTLLFALTNPDSYTNDTQAFIAPAGATLDPGVTYAVVVQPTTPGTNLDLYTTASDSEDDESLDGWSIGDAFDIENGGSWQPEPDGKALKIIVRGIAKVGPSLAPTGLTATAVGDNRIDLSWTAPTDDGGSAITGYRIESSADGSTGWSDLVADTDSTDTTHSHTGLMPNTTLHYRVSAINGEGTSEPSDTANATTDYPEVTVQFGGGPYTVAEGGTQAVTVVLSEDPLQTTVIPLMATGQGGAESDDYFVPSSVTFNSGETSKPFDFTATQDDVDDDNESVRLTFGTSLPSKVSVGTIDETTVSIIDDDDPEVTVSFGEPAYTVPEGGTVSVSVTLSADPERTVAIPLTATNQGSASSADYTVPSSVTFDADEMSKTITFTAADDSIDDDDESVLLAFGTLPPSVSLGTNTQATVSINDDDSVGVSVSEASLTIDEGGSCAYTIVLDSQPAAGVTITINDPSDNTDVTAEPASLTFTSTDWNSRKTVTVNAAQDADADDETATVTDTVTSTDSSYSGASANSVSITVTDNAPAGETVAFGQAAYRVTEGGGVSVTVSLNEDPERTVVILLVVTNQGGASDSDYSGVPESVTFNSGDTSTSFTLTAADDTLNETGESVKIAFGALPSTPIPVTAGAPDETTVTINGKSGQDMHTPPTVHFASPTYSVAEGNTVTVTVELSKAPGSDVVIPLTMTEQGEATFADYSGVPIDVTFAAADTQKPFTFEANQDMEDDDGESVLLGFSALPDGITATTGEASQTTVTITDDDDPQVTVMFGQTAYTVPEGDTVTVTIALSADPERTVAIPLTKTNQGGVSSADYSGVPATVTFNSGDTSKTFDFTATADAVDDDGESVRLGFGSSLPAGVSAGSPSETTVGITDDDDPSVTVSFGAATYTAAEGSTATVTVELSADPERTVVILITATGQGGADITDYFVPNSVTFAPDQTSQPFTFTALDDEEDDDDPQLRDPQVMVSFEADAYTVAEGGTQSVTVSLSADPERTVIIPLVATNKGGATSADYSGVPASVTFNAGETSTSFTFMATQDDMDEDCECVLLAFGALPSGVSEGPTQTAKVSIADIATTPEGTPTVPPAPTSLTAYGEDQILNVRWEIPAGEDARAPVTSYLVRYRQVGASSWRNVSRVNVSSSVREEDISGLTNRRAYEAQVAAVNRMGTGAWASVKGTPQAPYAVPPGPEGDEAFTLGRLSIYWLDPDADQTNVLQRESCTGSEGFRAFWTGPDGNRRADEWAVHINTRRGAGEVRYSFHESSGTPDGPYFSMNGTVNFEGDGALSLSVRGRFDSTWGTWWSPPVSLYCHEPEAPADTCSLQVQQQALENTPAEGEPRINGIPEAGQTLSADTTGIEDLDGLEDVVFQYRWLADDTDIAGATGSTYTVVSGDEGKAIRVGVFFTDDGGNEETLTSAPIVVTAAGLQLRSATVDGSAMTLTYSEELETGVSLPQAAFAEGQLLQRT